MEQGREVIPIVIGALGTIPKGLVMKLEHLENKGEVKTIQTTALRPEYWEESRKLKETCCHQNSSEISSANAGEKNSVKILIIYQDEILNNIINNTLIKN